jgi:predicted NAD/FAD-dependent oxidoreductase
MSRPSVAVVGAGAAGLAAAWALRDAAEVVVFEKSRGVAGRAATRRRTTPEGTWRYDHGAQYVKTPEGEAHRLIHDVLPTDGLVGIDRPVWTFDGDGRVAPGDEGHDRGGKWTYRAGVSELGKRLAEASGATVRTETAVRRIERTAQGWTVQAEGAPDAPFDAVVLTPPAPQSADLVQASALDADLRALLVDGLRRATYRKIYALVLAYAQPLRRPGDAYAFVNTDGAHPVSWIAFEEDKPGHAPRGSLLIAHMAAGWTRDHYGLDLGDLVAAARPLLGDLLGTPLGEPDWADRQRWRYALPDTAADADALALGAAHGLFFAGDFMAGKGRVHLAVESGLDAADRIRSTFS